MMKNTRFALAYNFSNNTDAAELKEAFLLLQRAGDGWELYTHPLNDWDSAERVIEDLARYCGFDSGDVSRAPVASTVIAERGWLTDLHVYDVEVHELPPVVAGTEWFSFFQLTHDDELWDRLDTAAKAVVEPFRDSVEAGK